MTRTANPADRLACAQPVAYPSPAGGALGTVDTIRYAPGGVIVARYTVLDADGVTRLTFPADDVEGLADELCTCGRRIYFDARTDDYRHAVEPLRGCSTIPSHDGVAGYPIADELAARGITNLVAPLEAEGFTLGQPVTRIADRAAGTVVGFNSRPAGYLVCVRFALTGPHSITRWLTAAELEAAAR